MPSFRPACFNLDLRWPFAYFVSITFLSLPLFYLNSFSLIQELVASQQSLLKHPEMEIKKGEFVEKFLRLTGHSLLLLLQAALLALDLGLLLGVMICMRKFAHQEFSASLLIPEIVALTCLLTMAVSFIGSSRLALLLLVGASCMWPVLGSIVRSFRQIPEDYVNLARAFRLTRWMSLSQIIIPSIGRPLLKGVRSTLAITWIVILVTEILTVTPGLGSFLFYSINIRTLGHTSICLLSVIVILLVLDRLIYLVETRLPVCGS